MSRSLFIGGLAVGGGIALAALALREREPLARAAIAVHTASQEAVKKGARKVAETVKGITGGISQAKLEMILRYNIGALADAYRGSLSWGLVMAMIEHESANTFDPYIYNYTFVNPKTKKTSYPSARATQGAALVEEWKNPGDGGFQHDPHAVGLLQILDRIRINLDKKKVSHKPFGYAGVPLPYLNDLVDPEKNVKAALAGANANAKKLKAAVPGISGVLLDELIYWCHANGRGTLTGGEYPGAFSKLKAAGQAITWANLVSLPWGVPGWWKLANKISGVAYVAGRATTWEKKKGGIVQMGPPEPRVGAEAADPTMVATITQSTVDVLIAEAQEAEMERDLDTAVALRAQVAALQGSVA